VVFICRLSSLGKIGQINGILRIVSIHRNRFDWKQVDELNEVDQEEHRCRLRTAQLHAVIQRCMRTSSTGAKATSVMFSTVAPPCNTTRKLAAAQFNALLALKKLHIVYVEQLHPFSDIAIGPGPKFETRLG
jgi:chromatin segregation and condensation protein Rec8/ScpA/Scc1 (kleisin family)